MNKQFDLPESPFLEECQRKLEGIQPVQEKRKGNLLRIGGYIAGAIALGIGLFYIGIEIRKFRLFGAITASLGPFLLFFAGGLTSREVKLWSLGFKQDILKSFDFILSHDERFLALSIAKVSDYFHIPDWFGSENSPFMSYFLFTNKRILLVAFKPHITNLRHATRYLKTGEFTSLVSNIFVIPLGNMEKVRFGGWIRRVPLYNLLYKKIAVAPVGETESGSWILIDTKFTNNGKTINEIMKRFN
jgi:hypothetical protein